MARAQRLTAPKSATNTVTVTASRATTKRARATIKIDTGDVLSTSAGGVTG